MGAPVAVLLLVTALVAVAAGQRSQSSAAEPRAGSSAPPPAVAPATTASTASTPTAAPRRRPARIGEADGVVPAGVTVVDAVPAVARLDPDLLGVLRRAARSAAVEGVTLDVNSGWRSERYQDQLLHEAVAKYGSVEEAARWVATAATSPHVSGDAVDIGPATADAWLSRHGARYGLCQIYRNEPWHYELRPGAVSRGCPRMYADPTQDPRMRP